MANKKCGGAGFDVLGKKGVRHGIRGVENVQAGVAVWRGGAGGGEGCFGAPQVVSGCVQVGVLGGVAATGGCAVGGVRCGACCGVRGRGCGWVWLSVWRLGLGLG